MKKRPANWKHPISKDAVLSHTSVPHEAIDDYELPAHIDVDYSKAKPNRFAKPTERPTSKRVKTARGTKRTTEATERHTVTLYKRQVKMLKKIDGSISRAIRIVLDASSAQK